MRPAVAARAHYQLIYINPTRRHTYYTLLASLCHAITGTTSIAGRAVIPIITGITTLANTTSTRIVVTTRVNMTDAG